MPDTLLAPDVPGFHGDLYLLQLVDSLLARCSWFIATGTNAGTTLAHVARNYPHVRCLSCEPDPSAFEQTISRTRHLKNVTVYAEDSTSFLQRLEREWSASMGASVLFWLDAHDRGATCLLRDEVRFITSRYSSPFILIDDFTVPDAPCFTHEQQDGQKCNDAFIRDSIPQDRPCALYYPSYIENTSQHHPLVGWGLVEYGHDGLDLESELPGVVRAEPRAAATRAPLAAIEAAERSFAEGRIPEALASLIHIGQADSTSARLWNDLGVCFEALGSPTHARTSFERALELDPTYAHARENLVAIETSHPEPATPTSSHSHALSTPLPALTDSPIRYLSQHGEDFLLDLVFADQASGYFVEVGAIDGLRFSNTYLFESRGWTGVCIEPHPLYYPFLVRNRPRSRCFQVAVSDCNSKGAVFFANTAGSLSALKPLGNEEALREEFGKSFSGYEEIRVRTTTLDDLLREARAPVAFQILSIDVEGTERDVLNGFTLETYWPRVVIIEQNTPEDRYEDYFLPKGYILARKLGCNLIYCRDAYDAARIRGAPQVETQPTPHPLAPLWNSSS
ncbi:MAG: FkbM family methyltransferase [Planctomycetota bacterium]